MDEIEEANCLMMENFYRQERWEDEWFIYAMVGEGGRVWTIPKVDAHPVNVDHSGDGGT